MIKSVVKRRFVEIIHMCLVLQQKLDNFIITMYGYNVQRSTVGPQQIVGLHPVLLLLEEPVDEPCPSLLFECVQGDRRTTCFRLGLMHL